MILCLLNNFSKKKKENYLILLDRTQPSRLTSRATFLPIDPAQILLQQRHNKKQLLLTHTHHNNNNNNNNNYKRNRKEEG